MKIPLQHVRKTLPHQTSSFTGYFESKVKNDKEIDIKDISSDEEVSNELNEYELSQNEVLGQLNHNQNLSNNLNNTSNNPNNQDLLDKDITDYVMKKNVDALHLIVLVHGFQGNSYDMRLLKYNLSLINSSLIFLSSQANQSNTEEDFFIMGEKLANEVKSFIKEWNDGVIIKKISFIGHSIGGLIIRSALPHLSHLKNKMFFYISLSSPHLGYMYSKSSLIDAGMWVLKKISSCKSLDQLSMSDTNDLTTTTLYKMSEFIGFEWFEHIYLVSSHQDYYAPFESTRIQFCSKSSGQDYKGQIYRKMANNLLGKLTKNSLKRLDCNFVINESNLDSFIGRTAHIQFLDNQNFMRTLFFGNIDILS